jgi:hypothetical protein
MAYRETGENAPGQVLRCGRPRTKESLSNYSTAPEKSDACGPSGGATMISERLLSQGGGAMTVARRISLLLMLVSVLGCASQIQPAQTSQPGAEKGQQDQPKKTAIPTFTYRPGY